MRIVTGADNGLVKLVNVEKELLLGCWGRQETSECVDRLFCSDDAEDKMESMFVVRRSNVVEHWNIENGSIIQQIRLPDLKTKLPHRYTGLYHFKNDNTGSVMVSNNFGDVYVLPFDSLEEKNQQPDPIHSFKIGEDIESVKVNFNKETELAGGGESQPLRLWDINTGKKIWNSKNVTANAVRLVPPIWVRDLTFLPNQPQSIVTVTSYAQIRLYDTRAQRRPLCNEVAGNKAFICVTPTPDGNSVIAGNSIGEIFKYDLRKQKLLGKFKGKIVGSIRGISCHPTEPLFACVSLDRHCRIFDYNTREMKLKMYMKQRLNVCAFLKEGPIEEDEETWEQMPATGDQSENDSDSDSESSDFEEIEAKPLQKRKARPSKSQKTAAAPKRQRKK